MPRSVSGLIGFWLPLLLCVPLQAAADPGAAHKGLAHEAAPLQGVRPFPDADLGSVPSGADQEAAEPEDRLVILPETKLKSWPPTSGRSMPPRILLYFRNSRSPVIHPGICF